MHTCSSAANWTSNIASVVRYPSCCRLQFITNLHTTAIRSYVPAFAYFSGQLTPTHLYGFYLLNLLLLLLRSSPTNFTVDSPKISPTSKTS